MEITEVIEVGIIKNAKDTPITCDIDKKRLVTRNDLLQQRNGIKHVNIGIFMKEGALFY